MGTPQIILLVLIGLRLLITANKHGQPRTDKYNIFFALLDVGVLIWILIAGGFFR
jgi:hypothetical protein